MEIQVELAGLVSPDKSRAFMPDKYAVLLQEKGGRRRCLIGFPHQFYAYIITAIYEVVTGEAQSALHGEMVRMLGNAGVTIQKLSIARDAQGNYAGTFSVQQGEVYRQEPAKLADALPMAFQAHCPIVIDEALLEDCEQKFHAVEGHFMIVDRIADIPLRQAEKVLQGAGPLTQN